MNLKNRVEKIEASHPKHDPLYDLLEELKPKTRGLIVSELKAIVDSANDKVSDVKAKDKGTTQRQRIEIIDEVRKLSIPRTRWILEGVAPQMVGDDE